MPPEKRDPALLAEMLKAAEAALHALDGIDLQRYLTDESLQAIVERRLITVGEAANAISQTLRSAQPKIPWSDLIKQRHIFVHVYNRINNRRTWLYVVTDLPRIIDDLRLILPPLDPAKENT